MHHQLPTIPFTAQAYKEMQDEFAKLTQLREEVMGRLKIAREMGDLSENGAYKYAKFELGNIGRSLKRLTHLLEVGRVVEVEDTGRARFGNTITLVGDAGTLTFMLVSEHESNPVEKKLSYKSPIGSAVQNKRVGDTVVVQTPAGQVQYTIQKIG